MRRRLLIAFFSIVLAAAVAVGATLDHRYKQARVNRAELGEWYCANLGSRCGGASSERIESRWEGREVGYKIAFGGLVATAALLGGSTLFFAAKRTGAPSQ